MENKKNNLSDAGGTINVKNALLNSEEEQKNVKIDPFSPSNTGNPVIIYDTDGNRVGNVWSPSKNNLGSAISNVEKGSATKIYYDSKTGEFTNYPSSSMSYANGKITLNVAKDVAESDWYKKLVSSDEFKQLASLYKLDPTGKTELEVLEKDENGDDKKSRKTINDILQGYADQIKKNSKKYQSNVDIRTNLIRATGGSLVLTDDDLIYMMNHTNFSKDNYGNSDVVFLPKSINDYFKDYKTYDEESGSISADTFYKEFFNLSSDLPKSAQEIIETLGNGELGDGEEAIKQFGESDKDYAVDLIRLKVSQEMIDIVERLSFYKEDMSAEEKAGLATEYAKCYSLYQMMRKDTPNSDSWSGFNMGVQAISTGVAISTLNSVEGMEHLLSQAVYIAVDGGVRAAAAISAPFSWLGELFGNFFSGGWDKMTQETKNMYEHFDEWYSQNSDENSVLGELRESIQGVGKAIENGDNTKIVFKEGWDADGKIIAGADLTANARDLALSYANTEAMVRIGQVTGLILTQIVMTNPIGEAVGSLANWGMRELISVGITGARFSTLMSMANVFATLASNAGTAAMATKYLNLINLISKVSGVTGFAANMLAQGVVDTFVENPAMTDALLFNEDDKDVTSFQNAIRWNIVFNTIGEFVPFAGKGARKGMKFIASNTRWGAVTQALLRKGINRLTLRGRKIYEGIAEFMTRNVPEEVIEQADATSAATKKLNMMKHMQDLRKEVIAVQEDIKNAKIFRGEGSWSENAKIVDDLTQTRIDLETKLGISKKIAIAESRNRIIKNAGLEIEVADLSDQTAELTILSKKMRQTNLPGSFSKETSDYINDLYNKQLLDAKEAYLLSKGKLLSKEEQAAYDILKQRIIDYEASIPEQYAAAYKEAANNYLEASYRFYDKLNAFLASDAGGNVITEEELARMRSGIYGAKYMHQYAVNGYNGAKTIEDLLSNPSKVVEQGKVRVEDIRFNKKMFSDEVTYFDPNFTRDMVLNHYANISNGIMRGEAVARAGRATSVQVDSSGKILKTSDEITKAKKGLYRDLERKFGLALRETDELSMVTAAATEKNIQKFWSRAKRSAQRKVNEILGLNKKGLVSFASFMNSEQIHQISTVYSMPKYSAKIRTNADLQAIYNSLSPAQKEIVDKALNGEKLTLRGWNDAITNNNLDIALSRQYIAENSAILNSTAYKDIVAKAREESLTEEEALALKNSRLDVENAEKELLSEDKGVGKASKQLKSYLKKTVRRSITESVDAMAEALIASDNQYLNALVKEFEKAGVSEDLARKYIIYQWMQDNIKEGGIIQHIAFDYYSDYSSVTGIKASKDAAQGYSKNFRDAAESVVESKLNKTIAQVQEVGGKNTDMLIDMESTVARTEKYLKDISDMYGRHEIIEAWDRTTGDFIYYKVDRGTYNLVTNYPTFQKNNIVTRTLARINAIARIGQITLRMASLVTQGFKDSLNAIVLGGWDQIMLDNPDAYKKIAEYISEDVIEAFKKEMTPSAWQDFLAKASWEQGVSLSDVNIREAIAKAEINNEFLEAKIKGVGTSSSYFNLKNLYENAAEGDIAADTWAKNKTKWQAAYDKASETLRKISQKRDSLIDAASNRINYLHNVREEFLRKQVYRQNFMDALAMGKSLDQARSYAQYFMENATTNFSRGVAWGAQIVRSIPYFGAMLNGASSMIRLLEVDPLGVMMRFTTDLVIPTVGLTVLSLQNETDAEIYRNIPEWDKKGNLIWVVNGQVETIPLPEELAKFILPIRHAVESMQGANKNAWQELLLNDILNMPTVPLDAIMMLDDKKINGDPSVLDRLSAVALDAFNTLAPTAARTAYIVQTGRDPYTGKEYGRMRLFEDENGEYQYMSTSEYDFCQDLSNLFNDWGWNVSALMAEGVLSSLFGTGSLDLIEGVRDLISSAQQGEANIIALLEPSMERAGAVMTGTTRTDEKQAQIAWYSLLNELKPQKNELLSPTGKLAKYAQDIDMASTAEEKAKKVELYNAEVRNWQNKVLERVKWYTSEYGDYFDRYKFASTITYMTTQFSIDNIKDSTAYYSARSEAVKTMYDAGFTSPNDNSVFGYAYRNPKSGEVAFKFTDPMVISLNKDLLWYQGDTVLRQLEEAIEFSGLKDEYNEVFYPAYSEAMKNKDYTKANKLAADWNVKVIKEIMPIIDEYNVGELLNKTSVIEYLDNYIKVPSTNDGMGRGKYYSSKTGLNKQRGFSQSYIKKIYNRLKEKE